MTLILAMLLLLYFLHEMQRNQKQNKQMWLWETKQFLNSKGNHQHNKKETYREKILANHISGKGLMFKIYKELIQILSIAKEIK